MVCDGDARTAVDVELLFGEGAEGRGAREFAELFAVSFATYMATVNRLSSGCVCGGARLGGVREGECGGEGAAGAGVGAQADGNVGGDPSVWPGRRRDAGARFGGNFGVVGSHARGPNYERNKADRERKKAAKATRKVDSDEAFGRPGGRFEKLDVFTQFQLADTQARRLILENKERIRELETKESMRKRGIDHAVEAVKMLKLAAECDALAGIGPQGERVSGWAKSIATSVSEEIATASKVGSVPSSSSTGLNPRVSVVGKTNRKVNVKPDLSVRALSMNKTEQWLVRKFGYSYDKLEETRRDVGRQIIFEDCVGDQKFISMHAVDKLDLVHFVTGFVV